MKATISGTPKMRSLVRESWRSSPLIHVRSARSPGSATSSAVVIHGPNGHEPSKPFARVHWRSARCRSRAREVVGHRVAGDLAAGPMTTASSPS